MAKKPIVFLSGGHGGTDPGAVGNNLKEKDINLQILLSCKEELERHNVKVVTSRTKDENDPVEDEVREANASGADVAASIHTNSAEGKNGDGSETYYYSTSEEGKRLAELCEAETKKIGQNSRGIKVGDHLWFIKGTTMPAVLCECGFINNPDDIKAIDTKAEQAAFGVAYAKAILKYLGIKYKEKKAKTTLYKVFKITRKQEGAFTKKANATALKKKLEKAGYEVEIKTTKK